MDAPDFIPDSQVPQQAPQAQNSSAPDFIPDDQVPQPTSTAGATAEGAAQGVLGPLAPYLERHVLEIPYSEQRARAAEHPIAKGVGEAAGLGAGMLTGTGEAALMGKAGEGAAAIAGLSEPASYVARVGSSAVKQAAEMAVLQGGDEAAKQVINDPEASSQSAIANIGLAAALGGAGGAFITGAVSPLWDATVGAPLEKFLGGLKDHLNGESKLPESIQNAANTLGIKLSPEMQAGMSGSPRAAQTFNELREGQHPKILAGVEHLNNTTSDAVMQAIGKSPEEIANYSEAEGGRAAMDSFKREYNAKYKPISDEFEKITKPFEAATVADVQKANLADRITQMAQNKGYLGVDLPQNKVIDAVLTRIPGFKTANDFAKLNTTINNLTHGDLQLTGVRRDLQSVLTDAHHNVMADAIGKEAPGLMSRYEAVRGEYKNLANVSSDIGAELGLGKFVGPKTLLAKLAEKRSPEEFLRRLSPKGNAEIIGFLGQHFPETLEQIRDNELKQLIKPSVLAAKGENAINSKVLSNGIERALAGQPERVKFALPNGALEKIQAAHTLQDALPAMKSSGTAGWIQKTILEHVPQSAMSTIALVTGHNPIMGYVAGHIGKLLARDVPDAVKLSLLRFMGSDQPIKAQGFKALVDFMHNTIKGEQLMTRATGNVFKAGAQVLTDSQMPNKANREKLEKIINQYEKTPEHLLELTNGQVGHYLPGHQAALTQTAAQSVQYLAKLKPQPYKPGPLDKAIEPSQAQLDRYHRALDIANQPALVMQHIKDGTLQTTDLQDLKTMYPALYNSFSQRLMTEMNNNVTEENHIPYKTRIGLSLFLGQPVDTTMSPMSIQSAQPQPQQQPQKPTAASKTKDLAKGAKSAQTPEQAAEERKVNGK